MEYFCCIRPLLCAYMQKMRKNIPFAFSVHADRLSACYHCGAAVGMGDGCRRCGVVFSVFLFSLRRLTSADGFVFLFLSSSVCPVAASDAGLASKSSKSSVASKICIQCMRPKSCVVWRLGCTVAYPSLSPFGMSLRQPLLIPYVVIMCGVCSFALASSSCGGAASCGYSRLPVRKGEGREVPFCVQ